MRHNSFGNSQCPMARSLEKVGEWWSILILRDAMYGLKRFDQFQKSLNIAPNMLTRRLTALVEGGLLERSQYLAKPPRFEYLLTQRGKDFWPVMVALMDWGNKHLCPEGESVLLARDAEPVPLVVHPVLYDQTAGQAITSEEYIFVPGPAAKEALKKRLSDAQRRKTQPV